MSPSLCHFRGGKGSDYKNLGIDNLFGPDIDVRYTKTYIGVRVIFITSRPHVMLMHFA